MASHLRSCATCRARVDEIRRDTTEFLEATGLKALPQDLIDAVIEAVAEEWDRER